MNHNRLISVSGLASNIVEQNLPPTQFINGNMCITAWCEVGPKPPPNQDAIGFCFESLSQTTRLVVCDGVSRSQNSEFAARVGVEVALNHVGTHGLLLAEHMLSSIQTGETTLLVADIKPHAFGYRLEYTQIGDSSLSVYRNGAIVFRTDECKPDYPESNLVTLSMRQQFANSRSGLPSKESTDLQSSLWLQLVNSAREFRKQTVYRGEYAYRYAGFIVDYWDKNQLTPDPELFDQYCFLFHSFISCRVSSLPKAFSKDSIQSAVFDLLPGDRVLMGSDGLLENYTHSETHRIVDAYGNDQLIASQSIQRALNNRFNNSKEPDAVWDRVNETVGDLVGLNPNATSSRSLFSITRVDKQAKDEKKPDNISMIVLSIPDAVVPSEV